MTYLRTVFLSIILISFCTVNLDAQDDLRFQKYAIGLSPSAFFNIFSGIQISNDVAIMPKLNATLETGYLFRRQGLLSPEFTLPVQGYRVKLGLQYLLMSSEKIGWTLGLNYLHRSQVVEFFAEDLDFTTLEGSQFFDRKTRSTLIGAEISSSVIWKINDRFRFESGVGLGYGENINDVLRNEMVDFDPNEVAFLVDPYLQDVQVPIFSFNINVSYALIKE